MKKIFSFAAALFMGLSAMAVDLTGVIPATTLTLPGTDAIEQMGWKKTVNFYALSNDTLIIHAYDAYQSRDKQTWVANSSNGNQSGAWEPMGSFKGSEYYGAVSGSTNNILCAKTKLTRPYSFRVTNCIGAAALVKTQNAQPIKLEAYEMTGDVPSATASFSVSNNTNNMSIINIDGLDPTKNYTIVIVGETENNAKDLFFYELAFVAAPPATNIAKIGSITIGDDKLEGVAEDVLSYDVELPFGTTEAPVVTATGSQANVQISVTQATALPGDATITATSADGTVTETYTIHFTVAATQSSDATLSDLKVNGVSIANFASETLDYTYEVAYADSVIKVITATLNDETATMTINQIDGQAPGVATVVVTAQDQTTVKTYTITFTRATALKVVNEIIMSNGFPAYQLAGEETIHAYYLEGTEAPTVVSHHVGANTTFAVNENVVTLTSTIDQSTKNYPFLVEPVTPFDGVDTVIFDGNETWVKSGYGFEPSTGKDGYKFSKTDGDYSREWNGKTHIDMFISEADTVYLLGSTKIDKDRDIRVYVNNVEAIEKTTLKKFGGVVAVPVKQRAPFYLSIRSAQTGGDGAIRGVVIKHMAAEATNVATLSGISVNGTAIADFATDQETYNVELPFGTTEVPVVEATKTQDNEQVQIAPAAALPGATTITVTSADETVVKTYTVTFTVASAPEVVLSNDATLKEYTYNGLTIPITANIYNYEVSLVAGTTTVPVVTATANDEKATVDITQATALPGEATIVVTAEDGTTQKTYKITFKVQEPVVVLGTDATLKDLTVDGKTIEGFKSERLLYSYMVEPNETKVPVIAATANDAKAKVSISQSATLPGVATVEVTSEDGKHTNTYKITFSVKEPSAIEDNAAEVKAQKVMIDGKVYIIRDGVRYTLLGAIAE